MARWSVLQLEKAMQKRLFRLRKQGHIDRALAAREHSAQGDQQQLVEVVKCCVAAARVVQTLPALAKLLQHLVVENGCAPPATIAHKRFAPEVSLSLRTPCKCDCPAFSRSRQTELSMALYRDVESDC